MSVTVQDPPPGLPEQMLRCKTADRLMSQLEKLEAADVEYHTQIVLCRDLNDGAELDRSIQDIMARQPYAQSMAVVPVGLTKFRQDCYPLKSFDAESAARVVDQVEQYQIRQRAKDGRTFIYLSDEFYLLSGRPLPPAEYYDGFPQLDNGIGLARSFIEDFKMAAEEAQQEEREADGKPVKLAVVSGTSIAPLLKRLADSLQLAKVEITMVPVVNNHFGSTVNVSGLLTAHDMLASLKGIDKQVDGILIPESALRTGDNIFLDDVSLDDFCQSLSCRVETVAGGNDFYTALADWHNYSGVGAGNASYMWQSNAAYTKRGGMLNE